MVLPYLYHNRLLGIQQPGKGKDIRETAEYGENRPTRSRIIHQHCQPIRLLLHLAHQAVTARLVFQIRDDIVACTGAQFVQTI